MYVKCECVYTYESGYMIISEQFFFTQIHTDISLYIYTISPLRKN